ncbi:MFS transporter [Vibrio zhugei]|uniref:MFS transporter n=1 Tax=Vibrio zhugei TaxID=2479546 RepID=A0ABV7C8M7_9VIBR|nr:MFS transporter [Vibrio zhugei]
MNNSDVITASPRIAIPVIALTLFAVASGYLMSLIPMILPVYGLNEHIANWLASAFFIGNFVGTFYTQKNVKRYGYRNAFIACLITLMVTTLALPVFIHAWTWMMLRFVGGIAVAGIFVIVESWLLHGNESGRAKRLGIYMIALYLGTTVGQLGISTIGITGYAPFVFIAIVLSMSAMTLVKAKGEQPDASESAKMSLKQMSRLSHSALIGGVVSGLTTAAIYGLMPLELMKRGLNSQEAGSLMAVVIVGAMVVQVLIPKLTQYLGRNLLMALLCFIGSAAAAIVMLDGGVVTLAICLFLIGAASFALYPIAINHACLNLNASYIVSATQAMLFCYSIGSIIGPLAADWFMQNHQGVMAYLFVTLLATCLYMLVASVKTKHQWVAGK